MVRTTHNDAISFASAHLCSKYIIWKQAELNYRQLSRHHEPSASKYMAMILAWFCVRQQNWTVTKTLSSWIRQYKHVGEDFAIHDFLFHYRVKKKLCEKSVRNEFSGMFALYGWRLCESIVLTELSFFSGIHQRSFIETWSLYHHIILIVG